MDTSLNLNGGTWIASKRGQRCIRPKKSAVEIGMVRWTTLSSGSKVVISARELTTRICIVAVVTVATGKRLFDPPRSRPSGEGDWACVRGTICQRAFGAGQVPGRPSGPQSRPPGESDIQPMKGGVKDHLGALGEVLERFTLYIGWSFLYLNYDGSAARCQDDTSSLSFCICSIVSADSF